MVSLPKGYISVSARETGRDVVGGAAGNLVKINYLASLQSAEGLLTATSHTACAQPGTAGATGSIYLQSIGTGSRLVNPLAGNEAQLSYTPSMQPLPPVGQLFRLADGARSGLNPTAWLTNEGSWYASSKFLTPLLSIRMMAAVQQPEPQGEGGVDY